MCFALFKTIAYHATIASCYGDYFYISSTYWILHLDQAKTLPLIPVTNPLKNIIKKNMSICMQKRTEEIDLCVLQSTQKQSLVNTEENMHHLVSRSMCVEEILLN